MSLVNKKDSDRFLNNVKTRLENAYWYKLCKDYSKIKSRKYTLRKYKGQFCSYPNEMKLCVCGCFRTHVWSDCNCETLKQLAQLKSIEEIYKYIITSKINFSYSNYGWEKNFYTLIEKTKMIKETLYKNHPPIIVLNDEILRAKKKRVKALQLWMNKYKNCYFHEKVFTYLALNKNFNIPSDIVKIVLSYIYY